MINGSWKLTFLVLGFTVASPTVRTKFFLVACKAAFENKRLLYNEPDKLKRATKNILQLSLQVTGYNISVEWEVLGGKIRWDRIRNDIFRQKNWNSKSVNTEPGQDDSARYCLHIGRRGNQW